MVFQLHSLLTQWLSLAGLRGDSTGAGAGVDPSITATDGSGPLNDVEVLVDDLNERHRSGTPSNNFGEVGNFLRMTDGICDVYDQKNCDHNLANAPPKGFFGGTLKGPSNLATALINEAMSSPKSIEYGDSTWIFPSWQAGYGPAAGTVYFPCAAEKATRCMWPVDGGSDARFLSCERFEYHKIGIESLPGCGDCINEGSVLEARDNTINGRTVHYLDNIPTEVNVSSYELELIFNRHNSNTMENTMTSSGNVTQLKNELTSSCQICSSSTNEFAKQHGMKIEDGTIINWFLLMRNRWYEAPGYYGTLKQEAEDSAAIEPKNELKKMLEAQANFFGTNHDYSKLPLAIGPPRWNEFVVEGKLVNDLESDRDFHKELNLEGMDDNGICDASIKALLLVCGVLDDPFFYGEPGTCLDFQEVYKQNFGTDAAPPLVYFDPKNFTHPFSSTCDLETSCGARETYLRKSDLWGHPHQLLLQH